VRVPAAKQPSALRWETQIRGTFTAGCMRVRFRAINVKHGVGADTRTVFPRAVYDELGSLTVVQYRPRGEKETIDRIDTPSAAAATKASILLLPRVACSSVPRGTTSPPATHFVSFLRDLSPVGRMIVRLLTDHAAFTSWPSCLFPVVRFQYALRVFGSVMSVWSHTNACGLP